MALLWLVVVSVAASSSWVNAQLCYVVAPGWRPATKVRAGAINETDLHKALTVSACSDIVVIGNFDLGNTSLQIRRSNLRIVGEAGFQGNRATVATARPVIRCTRFYEPQCGACRVTPACIQALSVQHVLIQNVHVDLHADAGSSLFGFEGVGVSSVALRNVNVVVQLRDSLASDVTTGAAIAFSGPTLPRGTRVLDAFRDAAALSFNNTIRTCVVRVEWSESDVANLRRADGKPSTPAERAMRAISVTLNHMFSISDVTSTAFWPARLTTTSAEAAVAGAVEVALCRDTTVSRVHVQGASVVVSSPDFNSAIHQLRISQPVSLHAGLLFRTVASMVFTSEDEITMWAGSRGATVSQVNVSGLSPLAVGMRWDTPMLCGLLASIRITAEHFSVQPMLVAAQMFRVVVADAAAGLPSGGDFGIVFADMREIARFVVPPNNSYVPTFTFVTATSDVTWARDATPPSAAADCSLVPPTWTPQPQSSAAPASDLPHHDTSADRWHWSPIAWLLLGVALLVIIALALALLVANRAMPQRVRPGSRSVTLIEPSMDDPMRRSPMREWSRRSAGLDLNSTVVSLSRGSRPQKVGLVAPIDRVATMESLTAPFVPGPFAAAGMSDRGGVSGVMRARTPDEDASCLTVDSDAFEDFSDLSSSVND